MIGTAWRRLWQFDEPRILQAQMALLDRNYMPAYAVSLVISLMTAFGLSAVTGGHEVWLWAALQVLVGTGATVVRRLTPPPRDGASTRRYAETVRILSGVGGLCWGSLACFVDPTHPLTLTIVMGMLGGMMAGAMVVYAGA